MANEKRLIDTNDFHAFLEVVRQDYLEENTFSSDFAAEVIETIQDEYLAKFPTVDAVDVEQYKALLEMYHELRENFIDYVCSGTCNVAPYCLNRCEGCVDRVGWCSQGSDECQGFNPAEVII